MTRLYILPFAGGSSHAFRDLIGRLAPHAAAQALDYPGHGTRFREPFLDTTQALADDALARVRRDIARGGDYAFWGHSMGAQVAFLVARRIRAEGLPPPRRLFLSARRAPSRLETARLWSSFSDPELIGTIKDLGGTRNAVLDCPELLDLFLPVLKADIRALERGDPESPGGLAVPLSVYRGLDDDVTDADADAWRLDTDGPFERVDFAGGHFFPMDHPDRVAEAIGRRLREDGCGG